MNSKMEIFLNSVIEYIVVFKFKKYLNKFPDEIPLTQTAFGLFDKDKKDVKYYIDGHRMWNKMMEYMTDKNRVYRFTNWGHSRGMDDICPTLLAAMGSRFEKISFFMIFTLLYLWSLVNVQNFRDFLKKYHLSTENEKTGI